MQTNFSENISGAFSLMWAVSMTGIMLSIGAGYDLSRLSQARTLAQITADNMALAASIAVDRKNSERFKENKYYRYDEIGTPGQDFTKSIKAKVQYNVVDTAAGQDGKKEILIARATVTGTYKAAFMGVFAKFSTIDFSAVADVTYAESKGSPASVFFVVDNSGSMGSRDRNGSTRIDSLKSSMKSFMTALAEINTNEKSVIRTGLFPYNSNIINNRVVNPKWNMLSEYSINVMQAGGGTNSVNALKRAKTKFKLENTAHEKKHGNGKPLKFLVFMTDGVNSTGGQYKQVCKNKKVWVPGKAAYIELYYRGRTYTYSRWSKWMRNYNTRRFPKTNGYYETRKECNRELIPGTSTNDLSLKQCTLMKQENVKIYAIAYGVGKGSTADKFMKKCSSGIVDYYKYAETGADLQSVFDQIGTSIVKEVVRLKR